MKPLTPAERRALRAKAHHVDPVVSVGQHGLTPAVMHEIDLALLAHELVKVRVFNDERDEREALLGQICSGLDCAAVQHLGKVLVLWRPNPEKKAKAAPATAATGARKSGAKVARKTGARTPVDPVRERRRSAATAAAPSNKGRRGAARNAPPTPPDEEVPAPIARRKSTYTPRTKPKSHSAKPNPRSAWEKPEPATGAPRRRRARS
jgi:RNA-binding protein